MINSINYGGVRKHAHPGILPPEDKLFLLHLISSFSASTTDDQLLLDYDLIYFWFLILLSEPCQKLCFVPWILLYQVYV